MTDDQIDKTIAKHIGWQSNAPDWSWADMLPPRYCRDLNAMHEAVQTIINKNDYLDYLEQVCKTDGWTIMNVEERFQIVNATAKQRAEAFLKTIGKWEE